MTSCGGSIVKEFREFLLGGNFIRVAAAFVIALTLNDLVKQFVASFVTPILGIIGSTDFKDLVFKIRGSSFTYGLFLDSLISFIVIMLVVFCCLILPIQKVIGPRFAPAWVKRKCPYCYEEMSAIGTRCSNCCGEVEPLNKN